MLGSVNKTGELGKAARAGSVEEVGTGCLALDNKDKVSFFLLSADEDDRSPSLVSLPLLLRDTALQANTDDDDDDDNEDDDDDCDGRNADLARLWILPSDKLRLNLKQ